MNGKGAVFDVVCCKSRKNDYIGEIPFCVSPLAGLSVTKETIMSFWAVLFGLLGAVSVCAASFFNDRILKQTYLVGNSMPVSVYGVFIVFVALINPFLGKRRLSAGQIAVVMAIALAGCPIPGSGLLRTFTSSLIMPVRYQQTEASWREHKILDLVPERMLPDYKSNDKVVEGFSAGLGEGDKHVAWKDVPWKEWKRPIVFWTPMIMVLWFAMIALGLMLHQQWSSHEHIPYPIAGFVDSLLPEEGSLMSPVFKDRFFWVGLIAVICIHLNNYLCVWFPEELIPVKLTLPLWGFGKVFPVIVRGGGGGLFGPVIYFCVIGICFLIPSDISFTFALAPWLWAFVCGMLVKYGITLTQTIEGSYWYNCLNAKMFLLYGSTLGLFLTICYTGRHYYWHVIKTAIWLEARGGRRTRHADVGMPYLPAVHGLFHRQFGLCGHGLAAGHHVRGRHRDLLCRHDAHHLRIRSFPFAAERFPVLYHLGYSWFDQLGSDDAAAHAADLRDSDLRPARIADAVHDELPEGFGTAETAVGEDQRMVRHRNGHRSRGGVGVDAVHPI